MLPLKHFTAAATSPYFETGDPDWVIFHFVGTIDGGTLAIECSADCGTTWTAFAPDDTAQVLTTELAASSDTVTKKYEIGGLRFRVKLTNGTTVSMKSYVTGRHVHIPDRQS